MPCHSDLAGHARCKCGKSEGLNKFREAVHMVTSSNFLSKRETGQLLTSVEHAKFHAMERCSTNATRHYVRLFDKSYSNIV